MACKDLIAIYGRLGLIVAVFALVIGIVAEPILPSLGSISVVVSKQKTDPANQLRLTPAALGVDEQG
jgi:hypothetical protein